MYREEEELFIWTVWRNGRRSSFLVGLGIVLASNISPGIFCSLREVFSFVHPFVQSLIHQIFTTPVLIQNWGCRGESAVTLKELTDRMGPWGRAEMMGWREVDIGDEGEVRKILNRVVIWPCSMEENPEVACCLCSADVHITRNRRDSRGRFVRFFFFLIS